MRFFSNDARESTDEQSADERAEEQAKEQSKDERPDRVQSDPVAVPQQRPPSPWSNTPAASSDTDRTDAERRDDVADPAAVTGRDDTGPPAFHEPGSQPTAFGAATVGGAVAASATANPVGDRPATDRDPAADTDDGVVTSSTNTYAGSTADSAPDTVPATWTERESRDPDGVVDLPLDDRTGTDADPATAGDRDANQDDSVTTYDDPDRAKTDALKDDGSSDDPEVVDSTVDDADRNTDPADAPLKDDGGVDDPKAVDPVTETPLDADSTADDSTADSTTPAIVAAPVAAAPAAAATAGPADTLFDQDDAKSFQERWRDVQLRFVDSPKDAAGDAAKLVDEAVEKLTASLRAQREGLNNDTEDTEQLRVQLRGYREILNRILSL